MFKKIKEFFSKSPTPEATWPFPTARAIDVPIIIPEPINAVPIPQPPPVVEQPAPKASATKTVAKNTKAPSTYINTAFAMSNHHTSQVPIIFYAIAS